MLFDGSNFDECSKLLGEYHDLTKVYLPEDPVVWIKTDSYEGGASVGDYIVKADDKEFYRCSPEEFNTNHGIIGD